MAQGGNYWTLFTPGIWKVLHAVLHILFKDPSADEPGFNAAVVDRDAFRAFLVAKGLEIVWIFTGEKSAHGGRPHGHGWGGMLEYWGLYRFNGDAIEGALSFHKKDARPEQLGEFLAHP